MGTRTTIKVRENNEIVASLYRHWDGYPAETGADLIEKAKEHYQDAGNFVAALLEERSENEPDRKIYRIEPTAGDIEHFYIISLSWNTPPIIYHAARPSWNSDIDEWTATAKKYTLAEFAEIVNKERKEINQKIERLKKTEPFYKDAELYTMIEA